MGYEELKKLIEEKNVKILKKTVSDGKKEFKLHNKQVKYPWYKPAKYIKLYNSWVNPDKIILINMILDNGDSVSFTIMMKETSFVFKERMYLVDLSMMYYNLSAKMYSIDYHQSLSLPVKREINVDKIHDALDEKRVECRTAINPSNLKRWETSSIVAKIFQGAELIKKIDDLIMMSYVKIGLGVFILCGVGYIIYQLAQMMGTV